MMFVLYAALLFFGATGHAQAAYYGKLLHSGWGDAPAHNLAGDIYAVDENTFQVIGFTFDGTPPGTVFLLGTDKTYTEVKEAGASSDLTATVIPNPQGTFEPLPQYDNEKVVLSLPAGKVLTDFTYISVWCRNFSVYFGGFDIPPGFTAPRPQVIGQFAQRAHQVQSGEVTVINDKTIHIKNLVYDGQGPDAFFYVGVGGISKQTAPFGKIPDENGNSGVIARYSGTDITLTLPASLSFTQLEWLSLYCLAFSENFGEVRFPSPLNVPPSLEIAIDREGMNCEPLSDNLQVSWLVKDGDITVELAGIIDRNTDYMAFGLSGSESTFAMVNSDVVVVDYKENEQPRAIDYFITAYSQCAANGGACPDTSTFNNGVENVKMPGGQVTNGVVRVHYTRPLNTGNGATDKVYKTDGTEQQIVWAVGPLNTNGEAAKHYATGRISSAKAINFGRPIANNCPSFVRKAEVEKPDFQPHHLYGKEETVFTAEIGQAGSEQGYLALTGQPSWGIAWYINGILIPELHLKRGVTYTFRVGGGSDPSKGAKYHPLYFTSDKEGGYQQKASPTETIFPGKLKGQPADFAAGDYCEWTLTEIALKSTESGKVYQCFEEFQNDLILSCDNRPTEYAEFQWTPDSSTPDLVYYQCYTHKSLGWKVHVYDELPAEELAATDCTGSSGAVTTFSLFTLLVSAASLLFM